MTGFHPWVLFFAGFFFGYPLKAETNPDIVLNGALQLADVYNWIDAAPAFREAERLYGERGDDRNAFYAKLGRIRSTMEQVSLPEISAWLTAELERNPILQNDDKLRLFCLVVKGDIYGEWIPGRCGRIGKQFGRWLRRSETRNGRTGLLAKSGSQPFSKEI